MYQHLRYGRHFYIPNLLYPRTFNEHILNRTYFRRYESMLFAQLVDKYEVRKYVEDNIGAEYLNKSFAYATSIEGVDLSLLPNSFIVKATHTSGDVYFVRDKHELNQSVFFEMLNLWLKKDYYEVSYEGQYKFVSKGLLFEEILLPKGGDLMDFKFFCFNGSVKAVQVDYDRFSGHKRVFYNECGKLLDVSLLFPRGEKSDLLPFNFDEMKNVAEILSKPFEFCRVDLYNVDSKIYFGELTFSPGGGCEPFDSYDSDVFMGSNFR